MTQLPSETIPDEKMRAAARMIAPFSSITPRAWVIGLTLIPLLILWLEYTECISCGPDMAGMSMPMAVIFALLALIAVNRVLQKCAPRLALSQAELLYIYAMNTVAFWIGGLGMVQFLQAGLVGFRYYATPANGWKDWWHLIPSWAVPDATAVSGYYAGHSSLLVHFGSWARPIGVWTAFIFVLLFCMYCVNTLIRRRWVDEEKLNFPMAVIPLEITQGGGDAPLWRAKTFWVGAGIAAVLESMAALHYTVLPAFPYIPLKPSEPGFDLGVAATLPPWNAIGYTPIAFYPFVIGLAFLLSLDVSFSCWFFFVIDRLELVAASSLGLHSGGADAGAGGAPYLGEQALGAYVAMALLSLYAARPHLAAAWRKAFLRGSTIDDTGEPMSYRAAFTGLIVSSLLLVAFTVALGVSPLVSCAFWLLFFGLSLTLTRIRAEAGLPLVYGAPGGAHANMIDIGGTRSFSDQDMVSLSMLRWVDSDWRCLPQPGELEAMKMASGAASRPLNPRHLTAAVLAAVIVGTLSAWFATLGLYYHYGAASATVDTWRTAQGHYGFDQLQTWLGASTSLDWPRLGGVATGGFFTLFFALLRSRFAWWPLNPIGYVVGGAGIMTWLWCPVLIGWMLKALILRYGGPRSYRRALPFFLGLVLGDYVVSCIWSLIFMAWGQPGYRTFPV